MPFTLIKGSFQIVGTSPDGDTLQFHPDNLEVVQSLLPANSRRRFDVNRRGNVKLRIEGIDTLETHYPVDEQTLHQPLDLAHEATDALLNFLDIRNVRWSANRATVISAKDGTPGFVLSRSIEKNGRVVAFVFAGDAPGADGDSVHLNPELLMKSYNYFAIAKGLAYPTYYQLFADLRNTFTEAALAARKSGAGVFAQDVTNQGFEVASLSTLTDDVVILPKLFRRLSTYVASNGTVQGFKESLERSREPVLDLVETNLTHFDTFVEEEGNTIRLTRLPEELVFDPMVTRPSDAFSEVVATGNVPFFAQPVA